MPETQPEYLACEPTPIGLVCLRQRALADDASTLVTEITLDHHFLMSSVNTASERALAERAIALHGGDALGVLVGGLGLGYTAHAVLDSPRVARVLVVEFLAPVIDWMRAGRLPLSESLAREPRLDVEQGDVYARLAGPPEPHWDLILIDVDHSPEEPLGPESQGFYGAEGLRRARRHLAPGGLLGVWSYTESPRFADTLAQVFAEVIVEPVRFENRLCNDLETNVLFFGRG